MYSVLSVLIFIVCILLILIVLVQNSKGGGLASSFSSSNQIMGVRKTTDFLEKATWTLAIALFLFCVSATFFIPKKEAAQSAIQDKMENIVTDRDLPVNDFSVTESSEPSKTTEAKEQEAK